MILGFSYSIYILSTKGGLYPPPPSHPKKLRGSCLLGCGWMREDVTIPFVLVGSLVVLNLNCARSPSNEAILIAPLLTTQVLPTQELAMNYAAAFQFGFSMRAPL